MLKSSEIPHCQNKVFSFSVTSSRSKVPVESERFFMVKELHMMPVYHIFALLIQFQSSFKEFFFHICAVFFPSLALWPQHDLFTRDVYWCATWVVQRQCIYFFHGPILLKDACELILLIKNLGILLLCLFFHSFIIINFFILDRILGNQEPVLEIQGMKWK